MSDSAINALVYGDDYEYPPNASPIDRQMVEEIDTVYAEAAEAQTEPCQLYRYFDRRVRLLYVGITTYLRARHDAHQNHSEFYPFAHYSTGWMYSSVEKARAAEIVAIKTERPIFNVVGLSPRRQLALRESYMSCSANQWIFNHRRVAPGYLLGSGSDGT